LGQAWDISTKKKKKTNNEATVLEKKPKGHPVEPLGKVGQKQTSRKRNTITFCAPCEREKQSTKKI